MKRLFLLLVLLSLTGCAGAKLEKQRAEIEDLQTKAGSLVSQLKEKTDEIEALKASKTELEARVAELEGRAAAAEGRISTLSRSNKDLSSAIGASKDALGASLNAALAEKDELARKLSETVKEKLAVERLKTIYQAAKDRTARELAKIKDEREKLAGRAAAVETEKKLAEEALSTARLRAREEMGAVADAVLGEIQAGAARVEQAGTEFSLILSDSALFDEGSAKLHEKGAALLGRAGPALKALSRRTLRVEGHSDNAPFKKGLLGGYSGHWELSAARAAAVARWLHEHAGLDPARLSAAGYGEFRPAKPNDGPEGRAANRRVAIVASPAE